MEKVIFVLLFSANALAHQGEDHSMHKEKEVIVSKNKLDLINESYKEKVSSIFESKCMDCHGALQKMPWYHSLPFAKSIMNEDMSEAKVHLDMRNGFPFQGHGTPKEDLKAISKVIEENEMPPLRYKLMHWSSVITKTEADIIQRWVDDSLIKLNEDEP